MNRDEAWGFTNFHTSMTTLTVRPSDTWWTVRHSDEGSMQLLSNVNKSNKINVINPGPWRGEGKGGGKLPRARQRLGAPPSRKKIKAHHISPLKNNFPQKGLARMFPRAPLWLSTGLVNPYFIELPRIIYLSVCFKEGSHWRSERPSSEQLAFLTTVRTATSVNRTAVKNTNRSDGSSDHQCDHTFRRIACVCSGVQPVGAVSSTQKQRRV